MWKWFLVSSVLFVTTTGLTCYRYQGTIAGWDKMDAKTRSEKGKTCQTGPICVRASDNVTFYGSCTSVCDQQFRDERRDRLLVQGLANRLKLNENLVVTCCDTDYCNGDIILPAADVHYSSDIEATTSTASTISLFLTLIVSYLFVPLFE